MIDDEDRAQINKGMENSESSIVHIRVHKEQGIDYVVSVMGPDAVMMIGALERAKSVLIAGLNNE